MQVKDEAAYKKYVNDNLGPYGSGVIRFEQRWMELMEQRLERGETIDQCAESTANEADSEGITGFMYGCAVSSLAHHWVHGEALRRWHNRTTQIGDEGERANENGGVLNPALLCIGEKKGE